MILAIDPSSTELGYAVLQGDDLLEYGGISTAKVHYEERFTCITEKLSLVRERHPEITEVACERAIRFRGRQVAALEVSVSTVKAWAKRHKLGISLYSPSEWKHSVIGHGGADKAQVARVVYLYYRSLPEGLSEHVTDAIAIGLHHQGIRRLEKMARKEK